MSHWTTIVATIYVIASNLGFHVANATTNATPINSCASENLSILIQSYVVGLEDTGKIVLGVDSYVHMNQRVPRTTNLDPSLLGFFCCRCSLYRVRKTCRRCSPYHASCRTTNFLCEGGAARLMGNSTQMASCRKSSLTHIRQASSQN